MARTISALLLVSAILVLAASSIYFRRGAGSTNGSATTRTHLHFYMHDEYTGPNPTAALIVPGRAPLPDIVGSSRRFGEIAVMNNALTEGPQRGSAGVHRSRAGARLRERPEHALGDGGWRVRRKFAGGEQQGRHRLGRARVRDRRRHRPVPVRAGLRAQPEL